MDLGFHAVNLAFRFVLIRVSRRRKCTKISCKIPTISLGFNKGFVRGAWILDFMQ